MRAKSVAQSPPVGVVLKFGVGLPAQICSSAFDHVSKLRDPLPVAFAIDEAHFWLNGYVNKQNFRIWSEANPQVYVETPLHPEKLTVWFALWAGGILL
ncbi:hypothetical protein TNCV_4678821 [Trichonephila clavipes]|nr:hypothetical protein TNCV_4678821 [Trichonephila clavipes]